MKTIRQIMALLAIGCFVAVLAPACSGGSSDSEPDVIEPQDYQPPSCEPSCDGALCGPDGCGGSCGSCGGQTACLDGKCECQPECENRACGDDGCGGACGQCPGTQTCMGYVCICTPQCENKECGEDGCGGNCGVCEGAQTSCEDGTCVCLAECAGMECGDDGCGGQCGSCPGDSLCTDGVCNCVPDCTDKECGNDGCGGDCGLCPDNRPFCVDYVCVKECDPQCDGLECGADGCGGTCGECEAGFDCAKGSCQESPCGVCPAETFCGYLPDYPTWCGGDGCADDLTYEGECGEDGKTLIWCDEGATLAIDCDLSDPEADCGWSEEVEYYDCM